ncbi:unnamed protein product [Adineta ricciae]|uniref:Uncharacterized protein n=1 Tax=Adineta ricciae TaxID=249248 RepID=A0A816H3L0_ADIRI|nr:unnamed protein product [Adineta ricciae]
MILLASILLLLFTSFSSSVPSCNVSLWANFKDMTCSGTPNSTFTAAVYNGSCTALPDDPKSAAYRFVYDAATKTVENFRVYNFKNCYPGLDLYFAKTPAPLNVCVPAFIYISPSSSSQIGGMVFSCTE